MNIAERIGAALAAFVAQPAAASEAMPGRSPATGQFTLSPKARRELNSKASMNGQLAVYVAVTPAEQRAAETDAFVARAAVERTRERAR
jgi:hypothetical protein